MVVCKYFQQGNCRFGQNCRFDHIYGSKYSYQANQNVTHTPGPASVTEQQLLQQVYNDVNAALNGGQWLLSSFAPFKEKPTFPGLSDHSPEEIRLLVYEAKSNNTLDQVVNYITTLTQEANSKYRQLLQPNAVIVKTLLSLYKGERPPNPFTSSSPTPSIFGKSPHSNDQSSTFRNHTPSNSSVFGTPDKPSNVFGNQSAPQNIFGPQSMNPSTPTAQSLFSQANQSIFNSNPLVQGSGVPGSIFAAASQKFFGSPSQDVFKQSPQNNVFQQTQSPIFSNNSPESSVFSQSSNAVVQNPGFSPSNVFGQVLPSNVTSNAFGQQSNETDPEIYSKLESLTPEDLNAYSADSFELGFIPESPPAQSLCF